MPLSNAPAATPLAVPFPGPTPSGVLAISAASMQHSALWPEPLYYGSRTLKALRKAWPWLWKMAASAALFYAVMLFLRRRARRARAKRVERSFALFGSSVRFGLDIGGTLCKVVYFEPESTNSPGQAALKARVSNFIRRSHSYGVTGRRDAALELSVPQIRGTLHFLHFQTSMMPNFVTIVKEHELSPNRVQAAEGEQEAAAMAPACTSRTRNSQHLPHHVHNPSTHLTVNSAHMARSYSAAWRSEEEFRQQYLSAMRDMPQGSATPAETSRPPSYSDACELHRPSQLADASSSSFPIPSVPSSSDDAHSVATTASASSSASNSPLAAGAPVHPPPTPAEPAPWPPQPSMPTIEEREEFVRLLLQQHALSAISLQLTPPEPQLDADPSRRFVCDVCCRAFGGIKAWRKHLRSSAQALIEHAALVCPLCPPQPVDSHFQLRLFPLSQLEDHCVEVHGARPAEEAAPVRSHAEDGHARSLEVEAEAEGEGETIAAGRISSESSRATTPAHAHSGASSVSCPSSPITGFSTAQRQGASSASATANFHPDPLQLPSATLAPPAAPPPSTASSASFFHRHFPAVPAPPPPPPVSATVCATGGGAFKFERLFREELHVTLHKTDELRALVTGLDFLIHTCPNECYYLSHYRFSEALVKQSVPSPVSYPYLVVNIGSGVSILKVSGPSTFERVGGTSLGGGTFFGLCRALTGCTSFEEALKLAERGRTGAADLLVGDIYGAETGLEQYGLGASTIAASFGKLVRGDALTDVSKEDLAKAALVMITNNIGSLANLYAHKVLHVPQMIFVGNFLTGNDMAKRGLAFAAEYWSRGTAKAMFLKHEGYFGAVGSLLSQE